MAEAVLFTVPAIIYLLVQSRGTGKDLGSARQRLGASWGSRSSYAWALLLLLPLLVASGLAFMLIPPGAVLDAPGVTIARITSASGVIAMVLRAVGEEIFFRGLLGGVLVRRLGFLRGNLLQATVFVLPHLALLLVDTRLWPVIPVQFAAGWLLGWLRHKTGTFVPGAAVHTITNAVAGLVVL
ncbi:CPBP family intramembrane glutamic endopeptidase [Streptosporangium sp. NPDC023615]|uniref:CPBP family intramembrane glutamic endopeptidase n=1 Tax=Streptosporangium sp. NPDC023615 TaxID=3154794 RepID=UPI003423C773